MNCPVCKCPNPAGATHCGMCYEVFNRSAAQTYLQAVKRERRMNEGGDDSSEAVIQSQREVSTTPSWVSQVNWKKVAQDTSSHVVRFWRIILMVSGVLVVLALLNTMVSAPFRFEHFGKKLSYAFSEKKRMIYLVGMKQNVKIWSERQGRLDTPIDKHTSDEMGNVIFLKMPGKKNRTVNVNVEEWIQIFRQDSGSTSRNIPSNHPSLIGGKILLDKNGGVLERRLPATPRTGKSVPFIALRFPKGSLKPGKTWKEPIEWIDDYDGWRVQWSGALVWTMGELEPCSAETCAQISSTADLVPKLLDAPDWARAALGNANGKASGMGQVAFDASHKKLVSHTFTYQGLLRVPIRSLDRIPAEYRVGRRVSGPGDIAIYVDNKVDIQAR